MIRSILLQIVSNHSSQTHHLDSRWVIGQIQEECDSFHTAILFEISSEETTSLHIDTHCSENDREVVLMTIVNIFGGLVDQTSLTTYLCSNFIVWKTSGGKDRNFLASCDRIHGINGRYSRGNHFFRVDLETIQSASCVKYLHISDLPASKDLWGYR